MTNRDVYNYNLNDEFQFTQYNAPPNAIRFQIIGKYFSTNNQTVYYIRSNNNYNTTLNTTTNPPHLDYTFSLFRDTVSYTHLDSLISNPYKNVLIDSCNSFKDTLYYSASYCGRLIYKPKSCSASCDDEVTCTTFMYGYGLGCIYQEYSHPKTNQDNIYELIYYKKDSLVCGKADTTKALSININKTPGEAIHVFPNPANDILILSLGSSDFPLELYLTDLSGNIITYQILPPHTEQTQLTISNFPEGLYFITFSSGTQRSTYKISILH